MKTYLYRRAEIKRLCFLVLIAKIYTGMNFILSKIFLVFLAIMQFTLLKTINTIARIDKNSEDLYEKFNRKFKSINVYLRP